VCKYHWRKVFPSSTLITKVIHDDFANGICFIKDHEMSSAFNAIIRMQMPAGITIQDFFRVTGIPEEVVRPFLIY
jgi:hypothetical protein